MLSTGNDGDDDGDNKDKEDNDKSDGGNDDDGGWQGINGLVIKASVDVTLDAVSTLNCSTSHYPTLHLKHLNCTPSDYTHFQIETP